MNLTDTVLEGTIPCYTEGYYCVTLKGITVLH